MTTTETLKTWRIRDRSGIADSPAYEITEESLVAAVRLLDGFERASHMEPINRIQGCHTYNVYRRAPRRSGADWERIGVVTASEVP